MRPHGETERRDPAHRLICEDCRVETRISAAWKRFERPDPGPEPEIEDRFVAAVLAALRRDRRLVVRERLALAAAAALLFSFFAGLAHEQATVPHPTPEDTYASAVTPSVMEGFIPN
jgi:hypothetical protein